LVLWRACFSNFVWQLFDADRPTNLTGQGGPVAEAWLVSAGGCWLLAAGCFAPLLLCELRLCWLLFAATCS
jgi:hypothetical protein